MIRKIKVLLMSFACVAALAVSAAALTVTPQNSNQNTDACCDMKGCCKGGDKDMACCNAKKGSKNNHACCKDHNGASCCCQGDSCPMPSKKTGNSGSN